MISSGRVSMSIPYRLTVLGFDAPWDRISCSIFWYGLYCMSAMRLCSSMSAPFHVKEVSFSPGIHLHLKLFPAHLNAFSASSASGIQISISPGSLWSGFAYSAAMTCPLTNKCLNPSWLSNFEKAHSVLVVFLLAFSIISTELTSCCLIVFSGNIPSGRVSMPSTNNPVTACSLAVLIISCQSQSANKFLSAGTPYIPLTIKDKNCSLIFPESYTIRILCCQWYTSSTFSSAQL